MQIRSSWCAAMLALVVGMAACERHPVETVREPFFGATVEGAVQSSYHGSGEFYVTSNLRAGGVTEFGVWSKANGASGETFLLFRRGGGVPAPGTYAIGTIDLTDGEARGYTAVYTRPGTMNEYFTSHSGELVITSSSPERVEGTFQFTGFRYCATDLQTGSVFGPCSIPAAAIAGAPTISVSGSFVAELMDPTATPL